jgi:hypothetical protein
MKSFLCPYRVHLLKLEADDLGNLGASGPFIPTREFRGVSYSESESTCYRRNNFEMLLGFERG